MDPLTEAKRLLAIQQSIAGHIAGAESRAQLLEWVLETIGGSLAWSWGAAWLTDAEGTLRCAATWRRPGVELTAFERATRAMDPAPCNSLPARAADADAPVWVADIGSETKIVRAGIAADAGLATGVGFPLAVGEVRAGAIEFFGPAIAEPDADLLAMFAAAGAQLAQCLDRWDTWEKLADNEELGRSVVEALDEGVVVFDADGRITSVNASAARILGMEAADVLGGSPRALGEADGPTFRVLHDDGSLMTPETSFALEALRTGTSRRELIVCIESGAGEVWASLNVVPLVREGEDAPHGVVVSMSDITERRRTERELEHLAYHDRLTGLPNRTLLEEHLALALARAGRHEHGVALLFLDLDDFKLVNDGFGHAAGDQLLRDVALRLQGVTRATDLLARQGGDEFLLLVTDLGGDAEGLASSVAEKLESALHEPFRLAGTSLDVRASIGVSIFPRDAEDAEALMRHADAAMYQAKSAGRGRVRVFER
jgi:diguanylate cyclase (GGDEF)-like protein/PAS domain S-box-containing protein